MVSARPWLRTILRCGALAIVYFCAGRLGLMVAPVKGVATTVWPPTGISLAALMLYGPSLWPGIALGAFAVNLSMGATPAMALGICIGNTLEAMVGAYLLRHVAKIHNSLDRIRDVVYFILLAVLGSTTLSATIGVLSTRLVFHSPQFDSLPHASPMYVWLVWWIGDCLGALLITPLLLTWMAPQEHLPPVRRAEAALLIFLQSVVSLVVFSGWNFAVPFSSSYVLFPGLIWAALRFGLRETTVIASLTDALAIWGTSLGHGPFVKPNATQSLISLQVFMGAVTTTALVLGAAIEERARLLRELHEAVAARDDFLGIASHDLRNPLAALSLQVQLLQRAARSPDQTQRLASTIERGVRRLSTLLDALLDVTHIRAGRLPLRIEELDLAQVAREVTERFRDESVQTGSALTLQCPQSVIGQWDRTRVEQILTNLISNALKYGSGRPVEISLTADEQTSLIQVQDHGIGIAPEDQERIFEQFERAAPSHTYSGAGLGLWIAHKLVSALQGTIQVESAPGLGSTFIVRLPRHSFAPGNQT